jgi:hypothetical protein
MSSEVNYQASQLLESLKGAKGKVSWQVGKMVNALLAKAQEENPDNVTLSVLDPLEPGPNEMFVKGVEADDVRAIVGQIVAATPVSIGIA